MNPPWPARPLNRRTLLASSLASAAVLSLPARAAGEEPGETARETARETTGEAGPDVVAAPPLEHEWEPVDLSFIKRAPYVVVSECVLPASPLVVSRVLADPEPWPRWLPLSKHVQYRKPYGLGTERDVTTTGGIIRERFFIWDEGERLAFSVSSSTLPVGKHFLEDWLLKPVQGGHTRFVWTIAFQGQPWAAPLGPVLMSTFKAVTPSSLARLAVIVRERAARGT